MEPSRYDAWYHTPKGSWISDRETALMLRLLQPSSGKSLLDVGSGTGHFTRRFADVGLRVTGLEPDPGMLDFSRCKHPDFSFVRGDARKLPFGDGRFDFVAAVTSLCFVSNPETALKEMWRVARSGVLVGLLNRKSLLYRRRAGKGGYIDARWDSLSTVKTWGALLDPPVGIWRWGTAVFLSDGTTSARILESCLPSCLPWGGFLAAFWGKNMS